MYKGFVIKKSTIDQLPPLLLAKDASTMYNKIAANINCDLESQRIALKNAIMGQNGVIDADEVMNACMPQKHTFSIYISHSHNDVKRAQKLANYILKRFNLTCFIDSNVWLNSQEDIQKPYDLMVKSGNSFQYDDILKSTAHVHAMLSMSLLKMMDSCECCIFIDPEEEYVPQDSVLSPWIYEEVTMFNYLDKHLNRTVRVTESFSQKPRIIYRCDFSNKKELLSYDMRRNSKGTNWLDDLYEK